VRAWHIKQRVGDAVFIPAGAPHQVCLSGLDQPAQGMRGGEGGRLFAFSHGDTPAHSCPNRKRFQTINLVSDVRKSRVVALPAWAMAAAGFPCHCHGTVT
jgi:hypothetical protein